MIKPDYIIRTNRRSMSLSISKDGQIVVRAPKRLQMEKILEFVNEKQTWINKHLNKIKQNQLINHDIKNFEAFLLFGKKYSLRQIDGVKKIEVCNEEIIYPLSWDKDKLVLRMQSYYKNTSKQVLSQRIEYFAKLMQLDYKSFAVKNYKARWGCCSKTGDIIINYKAIMLPHSIIDYILIHELSHLIEFNHSNRFYKIIECIMPDWKVNRKNLKNYNFLLTL